MPASDTKILLVEDNDLDAMVVQRLMRRMSLDHPIVRARNGEEALAILRPPQAEGSLVPPFVIVLDINMPRMNGFELLDELGDDPYLAQVPIFIVSTSTDDSDRRRAKQYRIRGYVVKPVTEPQLLEILESVDDGDGPPVDSSPD